MIDTAHARARANPLEQLSLQELRTRTSLKWTTHGPDVLPLWVAEMDVVLAPPILSALHQALDSGDTGYPGTGTAYAQALARFSADRWGWEGVAVERTAIVPDVMLGVVEALKLVTDPDDAVVICAPAYPPFYAFVVHADRRIVEARLGPDWRIDLDALEGAFVAARGASRRPAMLLSNPHNPTGVVHTREELTAVAALARRYGIRVLSDEIHAPLVLPGATFVPYLSVPGAEDGFALYSASKGWNLAGLKAALLVAGPDAAADLARLPEEVSHGPSHLGIMAHTAAFEQGRDWLDALLLALEANRDRLTSTVRASMPNLTLHRPESTYLAWIDCRRLGLHQDTASQAPRVVSDLAGPARMFLESARVALSSGHVFGSGGAGFVRLNFATSSRILDQALERMAVSVEALRA